MFNKFNFNILEKMFIKYIIETFLILANFGLFSLILTFDIPMARAFAFIAIMLLLNVFIYYLLRLWIDKTIKKDITTKVKDISQLKNILEDLIAKHKHTLDLYLKTTQDCIANFETVKEANVRTKQISQIISSQVEKSVDATQKEHSAMVENSEKLDFLKQRIQIIADLILDLSEYNQQIGSNVGLVEDIAEQTNMLALNAAVEAARAGEHGKGFAVVASEIRKLADESKQATTKISSLINDIQNVTNSTVMATEEGTKEIEMVVKTSNFTKSNLEEITNGVKSISENVSRITTDTQNAFSAEFNTTILEFSEEISNFLQELEKCVGQIDEMTNLYNEETTAKM